MNKSLATLWQRHPVVSRLLGAVLLCAVVAGAATVLPVAGQPGQPGRRISQVQVARQFVLALLRGDSAAAYERLEPEAKHAVSPTDFGVATLPWYVRGRQQGADIDLYKLGVRLGETDAELFYSFSLASDSLLKTPSVLLEVTFRDTASRRVQAFELR